MLGNTGTIKRNSLYSCLKSNTQQVAGLKVHQQLSMIMKTAENYRQFPGYLNSNFRKNSH
jgi:hypothetical protein